MLELKKAAGNLEGDKKQISNNVTVEDYDIICKNKPIVNIILQQAHNAGKLENYSLDQFYNKLELVKNSAYAELEQEIFDILGIPLRVNGATSLINIHHKEYNELYKLFADPNLSERKHKLEEFQDSYKSAKCDGKYNVEALNVLWNEFIDYAGSIFKWKEEDTNKLKSLEKEDSTELKGALLFHSLYPNFSDISLIINEYAEEIKKGLIDSELLPNTYTLIKSLYITILPQETNDIVNNLLVELQKEKPELFKEPDSLKETRAYTNNNVEHTVEAKSSGKEEEDINIDNDNSSANVGFSPADIHQAIVNSLHSQDLAVTLSGKDADYFNTSTMEQYALKS
jgi:hypothetical protein